MDLTQRISNPDRRTADVAPIVERRGGDDRRVPRWIQRKNEGKLPDKDMTESAA